MKRIALIFAALSLLYFVPAGGATRNTETQKLVSDYSRKEPLRSGIFGILAVRGSDTLAQYNRRLKMVPASNVKLITTGLALKQLGSSWRFSTTLAYSGSVKDGVLHGDLYIVGGGDPTTGSRSSCADSLLKTFRAWKDLLDKAGIKEITGHVVGDGRYFKRPLQSMTWQAEDMGFNYGAGPSGLNFFENAQAFSIKPSAPGKSPLVEPLYPETPWMSYVNSARTGEAKSANTIYYINSEYAPVGEFQGNFPSDRKSFKLEASNYYGPYTCAFYFYRYLLSGGMKVHGAYADVSPQGLLRTDLLFSDIGRKAAAPESLTALGKGWSPTLRQIVRDTNFESDNFYAETLFNILPMSLYGQTGRELSEKAVYELLASMGLKADGACRALPQQNVLEPRERRLHCLSSLPRQQKHPSEPYARRARRGQGKDKDEERLDERSTQFQRVHTSRRRQRLQDHLLLHHHQQHHRADLQSGANPGRDNTQPRPGALRSEIRIYGRYSVPSLQFRRARSRFRGRTASFG